MRKPGLMKGMKKEGEEGRFRREGETVIEDKGKEKGRKGGMLRKGR